MSRVDSTYVRPANAPDNSLPLAPANPAVSTATESAADQFESLVKPSYEAAAADSGLADMPDYNNAALLAAMRSSYQAESVAGLDSPDNNYVTDNPNTESHHAQQSAVAQQTTGSARWQLAQDTHVTSQTQVLHSETQTEQHINLTSQYSVDQQFSRQIVDTTTTAQVVEQTLQQYNEAQTDALIWQSLLATDQAQIEEEAVEASEERSIEEETEQAQIQHQQRQQAAERQANDERAQLDAPIEATERWQGEADRRAQTQAQDDRTAQQAYDTEDSQMPPRGAAPSRDLKTQTPSTDARLPATDAQDSSWGSQDTAETPQSMQLADGDDMSGQQTMQPQVSQEETPPPSNRADEAPQTRPDQDGVLLEPPSTPPQETEQEALKQPIVWVAPQKEGDALRADEENEPQQARESDDAAPQSEASDTSSSRESQSPQTARQGRPPQSQARWTALSRGQDDRTTAQQQTPSAPETTQQQVSAATTTLRGPDDTQSPSEQRSTAQSPQTRTGSAKSEQSSTAQSPQTRTSPAKSEQSSAAQSSQTRTGPTKSEQSSPTQSLGTRTASFTTGAPSATLGGSRSAAQSPQLETVPSGRGAAPRGGTQKQDPLLATSDTSSEALGSADEESAVTSDGTKRPLRASSDKAESAEDAESSQNSTRQRGFAIAALADALANKNAVAPQTMLGVETADQDDGLETEEASAHDDENAAAEGEHDDGATMVSNRAAARASTYLGSLGQPDGMKEPLPTMPRVSAAAQEVAATVLKNIMRGERGKARQVETPAEAPTEVSIDAQIDDIPAGAVVETANETPSLFEPKHLGALGRARASASRLIGTVGVNETSAPVDQNETIADTDSAAGDGTTISARHAMFIDDMHTQLQARASLILSSLSNQPLLALIWADVFRIQQARLDHLAAVASQSTDENGKPLPFDSDATTALRRRLQTASLAATKSASHDQDAWLKLWDLLNKQHDGDPWFRAALLATALQAPQAAMQMFKSTPTSQVVRFFRHDKARSFRAEWHSLDNSSLPASLLAKMEQSGKLKEALQSGTDDVSAVGGFADSMAAQTWLEAAERVYVNLQRQEANRGVGPFMNSPAQRTIRALETINGRDAYGVEITREPAHRGAIWRQLSRSNEPHHEPMVVTTLSDAPDGFIPSHAYTVLGTMERGKERHVALCNPTGMDAFASECEVFAVTFDTFLRNMDGIGMLMKTPR